MKRFEVIKILKLTPRYLWSLTNKGIIKTTKLPSGRLVYDEASVYKYIGRNKKSNEINVIYSRVSTSKQKNDLNNQVENLEKYCLSNGFKVHNIFKDVSSSINFESRKSFFTLLELVFEGEVARVFISYKDRLSRIGFDFFVKLFRQFGTEIIVVNETTNEKLASEEIFEEIITLIHCFSMKHYSKRKIAKLKEVIEKE